MVTAFVIWSLTAVLFVFLGRNSAKAEKPAGFFANSAAPEVRDVQGYNRSVGRIWYVAAVIFELLGLPLLFMKQNSLLAMVPVLGTVFLVLGMVIAYTQIEGKYRK